MEKSRKIRIAHLILAHTDPEHIVRLAKRLLPISDVYIHYDAKSDQTLLEERLKDEQGCYFLNKRFHCEWGGWNAVAAEVELIRMATEKKYDRYVFLQGADYPIKSNEYIYNFYAENQKVEYIRACCCSNSDDPNLYSKCRYVLMFNHKNIVKKVFNKLTRMFDLKFRNGYIRDENNEYPVYWGSAQWAISRSFAEYIIDFYDSHKKFNKWFYYAFPADELYFSTVVMNSKYKINTTNRGPEKEKRDLSEWRNLHYFEYLPGKIKVYTERDFETMKRKKELYVRKVNTKESTQLLNMLDSMKCCGEEKISNYGEKTENITST